MSASDRTPSGRAREVDSDEATIWRGVVDLLLAHGDRIADAMRLADALVAERRKHHVEKIAIRRARSGVRPAVSSIPPAIPQQASKLPPSKRDENDQGVTLRSAKR